jgi:hypothetical protein
MSAAMKPPRQRHLSAGCGPAWLGWRLLAAGALGALGLLGGCTTYVPVVPEAVKCEVPATLLQGCVPPAKLADGITYGELLAVYQGERQALQQCGTNHAALMQAVAACRAEVARHNAELGRLNESLKARK